MNGYQRIKIGSIITVMIGLMWAAVGLFDSLGQIAVGLLVAGIASTGWGLADWLEDAAIAEGRQQVWARRDSEI